ncbi:HalOD1 output domain-containing protein [Halobacterium bonnevillei]|uniref:Halobacterial output domain-containing protein n=1 Tax=Halobacterium bonnevillei TaxID=2692200 RepID=A0A6B0SNB8_9EURY|nr:HalOD1 output domain-containing protein [Halobacterium bonnevillei]MXR20340.1 hypothetical protein [Halobacterium bonnevillei]
MSDAPPSVRISDKVSANAGCDVVELPPLYDAIDPEQLDSLVETMTDGAVSFRYTGHDITVTSDGTVTLSDQPQQPDSPEVRNSDGAQ